MGGLVRRGHEVGLLTAGGVFEERVPALGARLFKVPTDAENLDRAVEMVQPYGFDLVHAHNYRAARFGRRLAERLGAAYLMSVHGPRRFWQRVTFRDWSPLVVAMSEGDRDNITGFGGIARERVLSSFYGIDTDRFRPRIGTGRLRTELVLPDGAVPIVHVSRFAHRKARVALGLVEAMPAIAAAVPGAIALIVGEGPEAERIRALAVQVNQAAGRELARVVGPRKDVECFMSLGAVVLATANTAVEAVACGAPTIAAGRTGYFGLVTAANFEDARAVCFADHGRLPRIVTAAPIVRDVCALLQDAPAARRDAVGAQQIVTERYNVERMTEQTEAIYHQVLGSGRASPAPSRTPPGPGPDAATRDAGVSTALPPAHDEEPS